MRPSSGTLLIAIGVLHCSVGVWFGWPEGVAILANGVVDAVEPEPERMYWFWFMVTGILTIVLGQLTRWVEGRPDSRLPRFLGWEVLALGLAATAAIPVSGGWLVIAAGVVMILRAGRPASATPVS